MGCHHHKYTSLNPGHHYHYYFSYCCYYQPNFCYWETALSLDDILYSPTGTLGLTETTVSLHTLLSPQHSFDTACCTRYNRKCTVLFRQDTCLVHRLGNKHALLCVDKVYDPSTSKCVVSPSLVLVWVMVLALVD